MEGEGKPSDYVEQPAARSERVYPPAEVQARLEVSASGLRRLAGIYERSVGPLPRDERGRVWPEAAVEDLEEARAAVREQRAVSIEAALRGQETSHSGTETAGRGYVPEGPVEHSRGHTGPAEAILEELRALRALVEEQNRRIGELEEAVRTGRKLPAGEISEASSESHETPEEGPEASNRGHTPREPHEGAQAVTEDAERGAWRRLLAWFGF